MNNIRKTRWGYKHIFIAAFLLLTIFVVAMFSLNPTIKAWASESTMPTELAKHIPTLEEDFKDDRVRIVAFRHANCYGF